MNEDEQTRLHQEAERFHQLERMRAWVHLEPEPDMGQSELDYELERSAKDWQDIRDADERRELAALREKARLYDKLCSELGPLKKKAEFWDALASRKVRLVAGIGAQSVWWADYGTKPGNYTDCTRNFPTAAEAVQAAIEAGALGPTTRDAGALK